MNRLRLIFAAAYILLTMLLLGGVIKHSAWFLAGLEPAGDNWFGWWLAAALDGGLVISALSIVVANVQRAAVPRRLNVAYWLLLGVSTLANVAHALAHNTLAAGGWWYWCSSIAGSAVLPAMLAIMPHAATQWLALLQPATQQQAQHNVTPAVALADVEQPTRNIVKQSTRQPSTNPAAVRARVYRAAKRNKE